VRRLLAGLPIGLSFALALWAVASATAAQSGRSQFRIGTDLVAVDFQAVDDRGQPVVDLKPAELTLKVDGRQRDLRALQFVKIAATTAEAPTPPPALPPPYGTNDVAAPGRAVVLVIDVEHIGAGDGKATLDAAARFLDRLAPADRVGLVTLPIGKVEVDLTTRHARVREALSRITGKAAPPSALWTISLTEALAVLAEHNTNFQDRTQELVNRECRYADEQSTCRSAVVQEALRVARETERATRASLLALTDFLEGVRGVEGPKTVVYIAAGLLRTNDTAVDLQDLTRAAAAARVQLYVVQPHQAMLDATARGVPPNLAQDDDLRHGGLEDLAGATGGALFRLAAAGDRAFARIADEISAYYLLGFEPRAAERDGKPHRIEVTTTRPGVLVRARPTFIVDDPARFDAPIVTREMVRDFAAHQDLPLRAAAYAFRHTDVANMRIAVALEPTEPTATLNAAAFALIDPQGRVAAEWVEEGAGVVARPLLSAIVVPPGDYRLRAAAVDTNGRRGAVDYEFRAALTDAAPLRLGPLLVGDSASGRFILQLQPPPSAPTLTAYTEVYGEMPLAVPMSVAFEIAATADGPALITAKGNILVSADIDRRVATAVLPLDKLAPGEYVVRAAVSFDGKIVGRTIRTLRR
jgi:VWFA-related protein